MLLSVFQEKFHVFLSNRTAALPCEEHLQIGCFHGPEGVSEPRDMKMYPEFKTVVRTRTQVSSEVIQDQCEKQNLLCVSLLHEETLPKKHY